MIWMNSRHRKRKEEKSAGADRGVPSGEFPDKRLGPAMGEGRVRFRGADSCSLLPLRQSVRGIQEPDLPDYFLQHDKNSPFPRVAGISEECLHKDTELFFLRILERMHRPFHRAALR